MDDQNLTLKEFATLAKVSRKTLVNMIKEGKICASKTSDGPKGHYRIQRSELHRPVSWELNRKNTEERK